MVDLKGKFIKRTESNQKEIKEFFENYATEEHNRSLKEYSIIGEYYGVVDSKTHDYKIITCTTTPSLYDGIITTIEELMENMKEPDMEIGMRQFETGATRNVDHNKIDYEGFLSPTALKAFGEYMHKNRLQADGKLRDSDNWQKGMPVDAYMKSMYRHFFDVWSTHRGIETPEDQISNLCGLMFNVQGMLHELLKAQKVIKIEEDELQG